MAKVWYHALSAKDDYSRTSKKDAAVLIQPGELSIDENVVFSIVFSASLFSFILCLERRYSLTPFSLSSASATIVKSSFRVVLIPNWQSFPGPWATVPNLNVLSNASKKSFAQPFSPAAFKSWTIFATISNNLPISFSKNGYGKCVDCVIQMSYISWFSWFCHFAFASFRPNAAVRRTHEWDPFRLFSRGSLTHT